MRVEQKTTYRCDGCGAESVNPKNWYSLKPLEPVTFSYPFAPEDFCPDCVAKLRSALESSNVIPLHSK